MHIQFLLPDIQGVPTGGNIFNAKLIDQLAKVVQVSSVVVENDEMTIPCQAEVVIVDSLLASSLSANFLDQNSKKLLLVHYLPFFDPSSGAELTAELHAQLLMYDGFITTSQYSKNCLKRAGINPDTIVVIYPGLDDAYRRNAPFVGKQIVEKQTDCCRMLTVSSLLPGKGLLPFVEVLESLPANNWQWDIAGDDSLDAAHGEAFKSRLKTSRFADKMRWLGRVAPEEMPALYAGYDLFVLPSLFETLGMAIREAMASGLPVVAYDVGGISESLASGGGVLVPPFDGRAMVQQIDTLNNDQKLRNRIGQHARSSALSFPSWQESGNALVKWLQQSRLNSN